MYIAEIVPAEHRGKFGAGFQLMTCLGSLVSLLLGLAHTQTVDWGNDDGRILVGYRITGTRGESDSSSVGSNNNIPQHANMRTTGAYNYANMPTAFDAWWWRFCLGFGAIPCLVTVVGFLLVGINEYESPVALASRGELEQADAVRKRLGIILLPTVVGEADNAEKTDSESGDSDSESESLCEGKRKTSTAQESVKLKVASRSVYGSTARMQALSLKKEESKGKRTAKGDGNAKEKLRYSKEERKEDSDSSKKEDSDSSHAESKESKSAWWALKHPKFRRGVILGCSLATFQQLNGICFWMSQSGSLFQKIFAGSDEGGNEGAMPNENGEDSLKKASNLGAVMACVLGALFLVVTFVLGLVVDKFGRRRLLLISAAGSTLFMLVGVIGVFLAANADSTASDSTASDSTASDSTASDSTADSSSTSSSTSRTSIILCCIANIGFIISYASGFGGVSWIYISEIYPAQIRSSCSSLANVFAWVAGAVICFAVGMIADHLDLVYIIFAVVNGLSFLFVWFFVVETKGTSIEDSPLYRRESRIH